MMAKPVDLQGVGQFNPNANPTHLHQDWERWLRAFELFAVGKGVTDANQKRALLLHSAGLELQDVFFTLKEVGGGEDTAYQKCVKTLNKHFEPKVNIPFERYEFRNTKQEHGETIDQYIVRLRRKAAHCQFDKVEDAIRDQVIEKCESHRLRVKLLERADVTLDQLRVIANTMELSERQSQSMEAKPSLPHSSVNKVSSFSNKSKTSKHRGPSNGGKVSSCFRCGQQGHFSKDPACPAKDKKCHKCGNIGHFSRCCKTKPQKPKFHNKGHVRQVEEDSHDDDGECLYAFEIDSDNGAKHVIKVGTIPVNMIVDSGSTANLVDKDTWNHLKERKIVCHESKKTTKKLYPYGSTKPLDLLGEFCCDISCDGNTVSKVTFYVVKNKAPALLSRETATRLGILKIGPHSSVYSVKEDIMFEYKDCFEGLGKLTDYELKLHIDPNVVPVAQKMYSVPLSLRHKVSDKLDELETLGVIEKAEGPTPWVSPVVVVPKPSGDIRLCVDMREANKAIIRERHPIPTVDDVLVEMNNSTVFSKIDLNMGFHQIVLSEESRPITTFITHKGLYRYKRLSFGVNAAPEMFQNAVGQVLKSCEGVSNIADDIIVHGEDQADHDLKLKKCMDTLRSRGLTVNLEKSQFNMNKVTFMGHVVSGKGVGPTEERVKDLVNSKKPTNASEVRSFLGLVNFSSRYIPDVATISEPLRLLTKKDQPFVWGSRQQAAFDELKTRMSNAETLGFFKQGRKTKLVTDASNVGLGAVLIQEHNGKERVISYASRTLTDTEKRYSTTEKEALAIVWACERYNVYLYGTEFELVTDHKPLEVIYSSKSSPSARVQRWVLRLLPYSFRVKYQQGSRNIADFLSRVTVEKNEIVHKSESDESDAFVRFVTVNSTPSALSTREVEESAANDEEIQELHNSIRTDRWEKTPNFMPVRYELSTIGHLVLRGTRIVVPKSLRKKCIELAHEGHLGIVGTKQNLRTKVWWPKMDKDVENYVKSCHGCQLVSQPAKPEPLTPTTLPAGPWQDLAIDLLGPLPSGDYIFVCVDYYSRFYEIDIMKTVTSERVIESLERMFTTHGLPLSITSDNGRQFVSEEFESFLENNAISHRCTTPLHPSANGEVERQNRSLLKRLKIAQAQGKNWKREIQKYLLAYRATPHSTTGVSPAELMFNRKLRTKLPDVQFTLNDEEVRDYDTHKKMKNKEYIDNRRQATMNNLEVGDKVLLKQNKTDKLSTPYEHEPYTLVEKFGNQVTVKSRSGLTRVRNSTHVKKYHQSVQSREQQNGNGEESNMDKLEDQSLVANPVNRNYGDANPVNRNYGDANPVNRNYGDSNRNYGDANRNYGDVNRNYGDANPVGRDDGDALPKVQPIKDAVVTPRRSGRERHVPGKFKDFEMG